MCVYIYIIYIFEVAVTPHCPLHSNESVKNGVQIRPYDISIISNHPWNHPLHIEDRCMEKENIDIQIRLHI